MTTPAGDRHHLPTTRQNLPKPGTFCRANNVMNKN